LVLPRLQKKEKRKTTREVKSNQMTKNKKQVQMRGVKTKDDIYSLFKIVDKLEQRISTLEKVIGKLQLKVGDVVLYIDKKAEQHGS